MCGNKGGHMYSFVYSLILNCAPSCELSALSTAQALSRLKTAAKAHGDISFTKAFLYEMVPILLKFILS